MKKGINEIMLKNKVVVVTGASSGIGALIAEKLSAEGAHVVLCARSADRLQEVGERISGSHELAIMDVRNSEQVESVMKGIQRQHGRIDVLVNNAGYGKFEAIMDMPTEEFQDMMDVNYMGIVRCTQAVLPGMLERGDGQIVNIASMAGRSERPNRLPIRLPNMLCWDLAMPCDRSCVIPELRYLPSIRDPSIPRSSRWRIQQAGMSRM